MITANNIQWTKEQYERMGIEITGEYDDLFYTVELPEGWQIKSTDHPMWNAVVDAKGRKRISFFYKSAFYDRDAFSNFERRIHISSEIADYDEKKYEHQPEYVPTGQVKKVWVDEHGNEVSNEPAYHQHLEADYDQYGSSAPRKTYRQINKPVYEKNPNYVKLTGYEKYSQPFHYEVYDYDGTVLFRSDVVKTDYEYAPTIHRKFYSHLDQVRCRAQEQCEEWLKVNYPNWKDFHAYWNS